MTYSFDVRTYSVTAVHRPFYTFVQIHGRIISICHAKRKPIIDYMSPNKGTHKLTRAMLAISDRIDERKCFVFGGGGGGWHGNAKHVIHLSNESYMYYIEGGFGIHCCATKNRSLQYGQIDMHYTSTRTNWLRKAILVWLSDESHYGFTHGERKKNHVINE